jgi:serine phosphatase RsbU (regulator of sigma subunit)
VQRILILLFLFGFNPALSQVHKVFSDIESTEYQLLESDKIVLDSLRPLYEASPDEFDKLNTLKLMIELIRDIKIWHPLNLSYRDAIDELKSVYPDSLVLRKHSAFCLEFMTVYFKKSNLSTGELWEDYQKRLTKLLNISDKSLNDELLVITAAKVNSQTKALAYDQGIRNSYRDGDSLYLALFLNRRGQFHKGDMAYLKSLKDFHEAEDVLNLMSNTDPPYGEVYYRNAVDLSLCYSILGDYQESVRLLKKLLGNSQGAHHDAHTAINLARQYLMMSMPEEALVFASNAMEYYLSIGDLDKVLATGNNKAKALAMLDKDQEFFEVIHLMDSLNVWEVHPRYIIEPYLRYYRIKGLYEIGGDFIDTLSLSWSFKEADFAVQDALLICDNSGRLKQALFFSELLRNEEGAGSSDILRKSLMVRDFKKERALLQKQHEHEITIQEQERKLQRTMSWGLALIAGIIGVSAFLIAKRLKVTKKQKRIIEVQKSLVDFQHKEMLESINYAQKIQQAMLNSTIEKTGVNQVHFFQPKDIVSGDFYWSKEIGGYQYFAVADCTGHGVPGALLSALGISFLNDIVQNEDQGDTDEILNRLRSKIIQELDQSSSGNRDGMDISLLRIDVENNCAQWSGANNPLYIVSGEAPALREIKGDKMPIGKYPAEKPFHKHEFDVLPGDRFFLFSDGFVDQFGGVKGKKFKSKSFKKLLIETKSLGLEEFAKKLKMTFDAWKDGYEQIDDVCVMSIELASLPEIKNLNNDLKESNSASLS